MIRLLIISFLSFIVPFINGCGSSSDHSNCFKLSDQAQGCVQGLDNIVNTSIVSKDSNVFIAEYQAGFIQGKLQRRGMIAARDNTWDSLYLVDPSHSFPKQIPPSLEEMNRAREFLMRNYEYTINYAQNRNGTALGRQMARIIFRLLGIYHGTKLEAPAELNFSGRWLPALSYFSNEENLLGYETTSLSFMDVYWLNANQDVMDVLSYLVDAPMHIAVEKCSAFVKKTSDDILITHNSWTWFLSQSQALNLYINDDFITMNVISPGTVGSLTDFGYNNKGILFNETTHHATYSEPQAERLWMFMRAALAEQFSSSLDEFYNYLSIEASGTYMNGYMVVDAKNSSIGLVEMSYRSFVYFQPNGSGEYNIITKPEGRSKVYDREMVTPDYFLGINYPASQQIRDDLQAIDTRPARKVQFMEMVGGVDDVEAAKALITYTDPDNPLSIYGRWDLGYGESPNPKTVPDGSVDAKVATASMALSAIGLQGVFDSDTDTPSFWMKYGTPHVHGKPFIWSDSQWSSQKRRDVPDIVNGSFQYLGMAIR